MDEKGDLESAPYARLADASTPLISNQDDTAIPTRKGLVTYIRLRPAYDPYYRFKLRMLCLMSLVFGLLLLTDDPPLRSALVSLPASTVSVLSHYSPFRTDIAKITQVATLPRHLIPQTYTHHSSTNRRLVIIGDVHGVYDEFTDLLFQISFNSSNDHVILAGDMIDKGPSSHSVISLMRSLNGSGVRGNHEDKILNIRAAYDADPSAFADDDSPELKVAKQLSKKDVKWLKECPLILRLGRLPGHKQRETVVVHAGLLPLVRLQDQKPFDVMHMRSISRLTGKGKRKGKFKHGTARYRAYEDRHEGDSPWFTVWNRIQARLKRKERTLVVYGHDSHVGFNERDWSIGLDSACVTGGRLSALIIEGQDEKTGKPRSRVESVKCKTYR